MEKRASKLTRVAAFLLALLLPVAIVAASLAGLERFRSFADMRESRNAGKVINGRVVEGGVVDVIERKLAQTEPDVVILGNSLSNTDLNPILLATELGLPKHKIQKFSIPNSIAAHWYAMLKNRAYANGHHPKVVLILSDLQSALALAPRSEASHLNLMVHMSRSEPVIDGKLGGRNFYLERVRENRGTLKNKALIAWRNLSVSALIFQSLRADERRIEDGLATAFDETRTNMRLHSNVLPIFNMQQDRDLLPFDPSELPHPRDSFMPEIAKLVARNGGEVFFLRPPMSPLLPESVGDIVLPETEREVPEVVSRAHGAALDLRGLRMDVGHFHNQDHMNTEGARRFTIVVAQILKEEGPLAEPGRREPEHIDFLRAFEVEEGRLVPVRTEVTFKSEPPPLPRADRPYTRGRFGVAVYQTDTMGFMSDQATTDMTPYALRCSPVRVLEDGVPLPLPNRTCEEAIKYRNGRTCHTPDRLVFSATSERDPFENGKSYSLALDPDRSCEGSRWLYPGDQMRIAAPPSERDRLTRGAGILAVRVIDAGAAGEAAEGGTLGLRLKVNGVMRLHAEVPLAAAVAGVRLPIEPRLGTAATNIQLEVVNESERYVLLRDARLVESPRGGT